MSFGGSEIVHSGATDANARIACVQDIEAGAATMNASFRKATSRGFPAPHPEPSSTLPAASLLLMPASFPMPSFPKAP